MSTVCKKKSRAMKTAPHLINIVVHVTLINIVFCNLKLSHNFIIIKWILQKLYSIVSAKKLLACMERTFVVVSFKVCNTWLNACDILPMLVQKSMCLEENLQANNVSFTVVLINFMYVRLAKWIITYCFFANHLF